MADVITRFKLETNQFDSALRNAANGLTNITKQLSLAGKDFDKFAQKHVESARSLGQVESGANNLKDKLRDLVSAYNNVAKAYNNLTKEQQQGDFGKAMAASLDQLQSRITQTKNELYSMSESTKQAGGSLGSLNDIFSTSITKLAGWGAAIAAVKGALDVAKDAFFASEQNIDSWGQAVEAGQAVYESFLTSINSGDVSGFLSRIGQITNAAIEAYNALDQLNTQKTIQSPQVAVKQAEISRMRTMLQTGRYVAPADGRSTGGMKTGDVLTKEQLSNISKNLEQALNEVATITRSQVKTSSTAIDKLYAEQAAVLGVSKQRFQQATSSWQNFQDAMDKANAYEKWRTENTTYTTQTTSTGAVIRTPNYDDSKNPYRDWAWVSRFKDDGERFQRLIQEIQNRESAKSTLYSQYGQAYRRINRAEGVNPYGNVGGGSAADKTDTELKQNEAAVAKLTEEYQKLATDAKTANDAQLSGIKERQTAIQTEIANLKARNEELKKFAAEAQGIQVNIGVNSSLPDLTAKLKELQAAQSQALTGTEWQEYQKQIEQVSLQIDAMKGKWKEGMKATISVNTEAIQKAIGESSKLQDLITKPKKQRSSAAVESNVNNVAADASKLEDIITKPKTGKVTITADTTDAKAKIGEVDAMIGDKTAKVTFTADNAEVLQKAAQIEGVQIDPKTLTVTANTAEAEDALSNIEGLTLQPKELDITADVQKVLDAITQIDGVTVDPKTLTVTANTAEAEYALSNIEGLTLQPKELDITADVQKVLDAITQIDDVTVDTKTLEITASTAEAYAKLQELFTNIEGTTVTFNVEPKQTEMSTGMSITTQGGMNAYISQLKSELANADLGSELYNSITAKLTDMTSLSNLVAESLKAGLGTALFDAADILGEDFWTRAMEGGVEDIDWQGIVDKINEKLKEMGLDPISLDFVTGNVSGKKTGKDDETPQAVGKIVGKVSTIVTSLQQLGVDIPEGLAKTLSVLQLIMTIMTTIEGLLTAIGITSFLKSIPIIGWLMHNGGVVHAATGYTVPGHNFSGDQVPAMLNSGELVLNKAQQGNLLSQLDNNGQGQNSQPYITGETIYLGLNNYLRRVGQGEIQTTR